ncbi:MAG: DJ-1/PfpI family protein [Planctomycetaceae bacterium]|nr:DJ-1/PfpI family protein [Planctomycetaceae bacterium]
MSQRTVGILTFDDVEVLDFTGPFEVFSVARLSEERRREEPSPFDVWLVAESDQPVTTSGGMKVLPLYTTANCPHLDILVIPGGWGTRRLLTHEPLLEWIRKQSDSVSLLTSVCTGALLLGQAGLLDGRRATTHWKSLDVMEELLPNVTVVRDQHVVEEGDVLTSAGISAGIEMALRVVARECGESVARATAAHMEYPFPEDNRRRVKA